MLVGCQGAPSADETGGSESGGESGSETDSADTDASESDTGPTWPGECAEPIPPVQLPDARLQPDLGGVLRDAHGRDVVMRGVNTGNRSKTAPFVPFPVTDDMTDAQFEAAASEYFARMNAWGLDTARLLFSWDALEPQRDLWNEGYLDRYEQMIDVAWAHGLRVIVDFHQDVWSENFCGDGFPTWSVEDPDAPWYDCPDAEWGIQYIFDAQVRTSFDRFYANEDQLIDEFVEMWAKLADRVGDHPGVVALEIVNEPGWGTANDVQAWKLDVLTPFHSARAAELHAIAPDVLIAYDNPGIDAVDLGVEVIDPLPEGDFLLYAPHMYRAATFGGGEGPGPELRLAEFATFAADNDTHVLLGEFGFEPDDEDGPPWLTAIADGVDTHRISATLWEYSINEVLWNYEDFSVVDADGNERVMLDVWVRPWLRAVAGSESSFTWSAEAGEGSASWTSDGGVTEIVLPPRLFADGPGSVDVSGQDACFTVDMDRGELRVTAAPGAQVELDFGVKPGD